MEKTPWKNYVRFLKWILKHTPQPTYNSFLRKSNLEFYIIFNMISFVIAQASVTIRLACSKAFNIFFQFFWCKDLTISLSTYAKLFKKTNISYPLIHLCTCAYQGLRNVSSSKNFAYMYLMDNSKNIFSRLAKLKLGNKHCK